MAEAGVTRGAEITQYLRADVLKNGSLAKGFSRIIVGYSNDITHIDISGRSAGYVNMVRA